VKYRSHINNHKHVNLGGYSLSTKSGNYWIHPRVGMIAISKTSPTQITILALV